MMMKQILRFWLAITLIFMSYTGALYSQEPEIRAVRIPEPADLSSEVPDKVLLIPIYRQGAFVGMQVYLMLAENPLACMGLTLKDIIITINDTPIVSEEIFAEFAELSVVRSITIERNKRRIRFEYTHDAQGSCVVVDYAETISVRARPPASVSRKHLDRVVYIKPGERSSVPPGALGVIPDQHVMYCMGLRYGDLVLAIDGEQHDRSVDPRDRFLKPRELQSLKIKRGAAYYQIQYVHDAQAPRICEEAGSYTEVRARLPETDGELSSSLKLTLLGSPELKTRMWSVSFLERRRTLACMGIPRSFQIQKLNGRIPTEAEIRRALTHPREISSLKIKDALERRFIHDPEAELDCTPWAPPPGTVPPLHPVTGEPASHSYIEAFHEMAIKFPANSLIPRYRKPEEHARLRKAAERLDAIQKRIEQRDRNLSESQVLEYFQARRKTLRDRIEISEYVLAKDTTYGANRETYEKILVESGARLKDLDTEETETLRWLRTIENDR